MKEIFTKTNQEQGFTLVELMIVIAIIGILAAIAVPNFLSYQRKGYDAAAQSEAMNFMHVAMNHFANVGTSDHIKLDPLSANTAEIPKGFESNADFTYDGFLSQNTKGDVSGTVTIKHTKSSTIFTVFGETGRVKKTN
jgi:prepilin-type N-terminal cleavage/methylation domain-containing protein